jgi:hypothetical protein
MRIRVQFRILIQGFVVKHSAGEQEIATQLSLGLYERRPSYQKSLQPSKKNIQHFIT